LNKEVLLQLKKSIGYEASELEQNISNKAIHTLCSIKGMADRASFLKKEPE
jgi:hypothetical protein